MKKIAGFKTESGNWEGSFKKWTEIVYYKDDKHFRMRLEQAETAQSLSHYDGAFVKEHLAKYNGVYDYTRNGDDVLITKDGVEVDDPRGYENGIYQACVCAALAAVYGEDFSGYEHNYRIRDDHAQPADD